MVINPFVRILIINNLGIFPNLWLGMTVSYHTQFFFHITRYCHFIPCHSISFNFIPFHSISIIPLHSPCLSGVSSPSLSTIADHDRPLSTISNHTGSSLWFTIPLWISCYTPRIQTRMVNHYYQPPILIKAYSLDWTPMARGSTARRVHGPVDGVCSAG